MSNTIYAHLVDNGNRAPDGYIVCRRSSHGVASPGVHGGGDIIGWGHTVDDALDQAAAVVGSGLPSGGLGRDPSEGAMIFHACAELLSACEDGWEHGGAESVCSIDWAVAPGLAAFID